MPKSTAPAARKRLTRADWLAAANRIFVQGGVTEVKVDKLARKMKVTRGSFYWHFRDRQDLLDALLEHWVTRNREEIAALRAGPGERAATFEQLLRLWLTQDASVPNWDIAMRGWARRSQAVAKIVVDVDLAWIDLLEEALRSVGYSQPESIVRARIFYFHQIGYARFHVSAQETLAQRVAWASLYYRAFIGRDPDPGFIDRLSETARSPRRARNAAASPPPA